MLMSFPRRKVHNKRGNRIPSIRALTWTKLCCSQQQEVPLTFARSFPRGPGGQGRSIWRKYVTPMDLVNSLENGGGEGEII